MRVLPSRARFAAPILNRLCAAAAVAASVTMVAPAEADLCADPAGACASRISSECLTRVGAGVLTAGAANNCDAQWDSYRNCLSGVAEQCDVQVRTRCADDRELALWDAVKDTEDPAQLQVFRETCPDSPFAELARLRQSALNVSTSTPQSVSALDPVDPGFDCAKATTPHEKTFCLDGRASRSSAALNETWARLRTALRGTEGFTEVRAAQRRWIGERDRICAGSETDVADPVRRAELGRCLAQVTDARRLALESFLRSPR